MKLHPRLSRAAIDLVTRFETFQPQAQPASGGGWTIGYGHTRSARGGAHVGRADAEALLLYDLTRAAEAVEAALFAPVTQRQFEALTAFAFNIGADNFRRSSALARINSGAELDAADEIERWRHAALGSGAQVVDALVRRRAAEKAHFLGLPEGFSKSPSAVLRPLTAQEHEATEPPPALIEGATPSATLSAVNSVRARLRQLVPEPEPAPEPEPEPAHEHVAQDAPAPPFVFPDAESDSPTTTVVTAPEPEAEVSPAPPLADLAHVPVESVAPEPPAFSARAMTPPPANDSAVPPPPPPAPIKAELVAAIPGATLPDEPAPIVSTFAGERSADIQRPSPGRRPSLRDVYILMTTLGVCLLVAATVLILGGRPELGNLATGVLGALLMSWGVYGVLGPRPTPA